jgi:hypothetical protein
MSQLYQSLSHSKCIMLYLCRSIAEKRCLERSASLWGHCFMSWRDIRNGATSEKIDKRVKDGVHCI